MEGVSFLFIFLIFICGILFNVIWGKLIGLGYGMVSFQNSIIDSLLMLTKNIQAIHEIQQLKYMHYELLDRDQKYIEFQKAIDKREVQSLRNTVIRNYINSVPHRYNHLVKFNDWNTAMLYLNKLLKERNDD
jgi:hypothetical protein